MINKFGWQERNVFLFFFFFQFQYKLLLYDLSKISKHDYTNLWVITNRFVKEGLEYEFSGARFLIRIEEKGDVVKARGGFKTSERGRHCASPRSTGHRSRARFRKRGARAAIEQKFTTQRENRFAVCQPARAFRQFMGSRALHRS